MGRLTVCRYIEMCIVQKLRPATNDCASFYLCKPSQYSGYDKIAAIRERENRLINTGENL